MRESMQRSSVPIVAAVLALAASPFAAAQWVLPVHGMPQAAAAQPDAGVLYDQTANDAGTHTVSQNFDTFFDAYDAQAADDFTVPEGQVWKLTEIDTRGVYFIFAGPADSENVTFYKDRNGRPGKVVGLMTDAAGKDDGTGNFRIKLPWYRLKAGTYWVSVQVNMTLNFSGEWGWENQTTHEGHPAMWQNPGDGFGTGCTEYRRERDCFRGSPGDQMFLLKGVIH